MTKEEHEEILNIVRQLQKSPAMNGAFDRLTSTVEEIKDTQSKMCGDMNVIILQQKEGTKKLDEMHLALYDPDKGLYRRINDSRTSDKDQDQNISHIREKQKEVKNELIEHSHRIVTIESTQSDLKNVAGERLEHLDSVVQMNKNTRKLFWAGCLAVAAFFLKEIGPAILALL